MDGPRTRLGRPGSSGHVEQRTITRSSARVAPARRNCSARTKKRSQRASETRASAGLPIERRISSWPTTSSGGTAARRSAAPRSSSIRRTDGCLRSRRRVRRCSMPARPRADPRCVRFLDRSATAERCILYHGVPRCDRLQQQLRDRAAPGTGRDTARGDSRGAAHSA